MSIVTSSGAAGGRAPASPGPARSRLRMALAVPAAVALSLPLFAAQALAGPVASAAVTDPTCTTAPTGVGLGSAAPAGNAESVARRAAARYFPADQVAMATAVAGAESSWNPTAVNKAAHGNYGLWQINSVHKSLLKKGNWRDPETNAWMAYQVWDDADGQLGDHQGRWTPWSVYNSGSYLAYLRDTPAPTTTGPAACPSAGGLAIRVGTWNVLRTNSTSHIAAGTGDLTAFADVFGLQEMGSPAKRAAAARGALGFTMTTDRTAVPIFYRTSQYSLLESGRELAFNAGQKVEHSGTDGKSVTAAKWVTWVHLMDNVTYQDFYLLNTHLLVGAENSHKSAKKNKLRLALYNRQLATLTRLVDGFRASGSPVFATCDCNVNYSPEARPVLTMREHGLTPSWQTLRGTPTHGKRFIDYVWSNGAPSSQITGAKHGSDHASLAVTFVASTLNVVTGSSTQTPATTRTVTDAQSGSTYQVPIPAGRAGKAMSFALDQLGDTWKFGSHGPDAWDCSALTSKAYRTAGITITAQSDAQHKELKRVSLAKAQPGDIFWHKGYVSIYLGTVGGERVVVGSLKSAGAVVIHTEGAADIKAVLRPTA